MLHKNTANNYIDSENVDKKIFASVLSIYQLAQLLNKKLGQRYQKIALAFLFYHFALSFKLLF
ncbi:hypothetical protein CWB89_00660 [Pseudoalteromonas piscicida]|uniref:Uncharacterized protein n=1 Tax=Pseudoalteromonas piscicida TaxID=43662 RepID=A0AAQ2ESR0_PSEO7|nr:hypothetical protein CWB95_08000 [Pseudoalteromonas piscicida]TMN85403.1 hypothetical protein CWB87_02160 [Pseudoalteromonas flavipulchra]TMN50886.1 hypothetical protein CWB91_14365 [Pseudoalteromonas piscicida]TMN57172.1 hypothetical protein CWB92_01190 [Pseudoalteromonas piscicida]TMN59463.1 hypothetical protein CWB93_02395 [Pseudoalteromonas piscicida]